MREETRKKISASLKGRSHPHPKNCRHCLRLKNRVRWKEDKQTGCWIWLGAVGKDGYGAAWSPRTDNTSGAYRVVYERLRGPIPTGKVLDHKCRNVLCVNPDHLRVVSSYVNTTENRKSLKLSYELAERIRREPRRWGFQVKIARKYGVSPATVCLVLKGSIWTKNIQ